MTFAERIVGTPLGRTARRARDAFGIFTASREGVGGLANDMLAEFLVTHLARRHFVDVGAHIGLMIADVQVHCPGVKITAFDPIPAKVKALRKRFPGAEIVECALADREGQASFFINPALTGYSSLDASGGQVEITVAVKRLDALVSDPDVVKIDVEGAELGVLRGAEHLKSRPVYMFESGPNDVLGYTKPDLWGWFDQRDYAVFAPDRIAHTAPPMSLDVFLDAHGYPRRASNFFGVPKEQIDETRERARQALRV